MAEKATELRDLEANFKLQLDACDLGRHENGDIAIKALDFRKTCERNGLRLTTR